MGPMGKLVRKSRLSRYKQERLIELFVVGATARTAARLLNVNRKTAILFHSLLSPPLRDQPRSSLINWRKKAKNCWLARSRRMKAVSAAGARVAARSKG